MKLLSSVFLTALFLIMPNLAFSDGGRLPRDVRNFPAAGGVDSDDQDGEVFPLLLDPITGELLTKSSSTVTGGATELKQDDIIAQLVLILAKIIAAPATAANQATIITALGDILTQVTTSQTSSEPVVISVGITPTLLFSADSTRRLAFMQNAGTSPVFLGKAAVTTTTGEILAGSNVVNNGLGATAKAEHGDTIFGIVAVCCVNVRVSEVSQ